MIEINLESTEDLIKELEMETKSPLPTPPVGFTVVWYDAARNDPGAEKAAIVTKVEGPGKLVLTIFPPNGMPIFNKKGILHTSHPVHERRGNAVSKNSGSWDYPAGITVPKSHNDLHLAELNKKIDSLKAQLAEASAIKDRQEKPESLKKAVAGKQGN